MSGAGAPHGADAAWVILETPLEPAALAAFCGNLERLYRINPFLEFASWTEDAPDSFRAEVLNHSNGRRSVLRGRVTRASADTLRVDYAEGIKASTRFEFASAAAGSRLTITDDYGPAAAGQAGEADRSLHAWGVALKAHLERDRRWSWLPLYRWAVERVWLPMKPSARRITFLVLVILIADIALIALGFAIYWLEYAR